MARLNYAVNEDMLKRAYKNTKLFSIIDEFYMSDKTIAEFVFADGEYSSANNARNALNQSLDRRHIYSIKVFTRQGKVYLVKDRKENADA